MLLFFNGRNKSKFYLTNIHFMKNRAGQLIAMMYLLAIMPAKAQTVSQVFSNSGIWADYGVPVSPKVYPEFKGRLVNINWADFEVAPNVWDWTIFDKDINDHIADSMPVIILVYTRMNAPDWIFSNGVPKVNETNVIGTVIGYSPYYLDSDYNVYFKRMITKVREHVQAYQPAIRNKIIGVQACFGSTGDQIAYKGNVAKQYEITDAQFDSLFKVYSLYYYNEYKNLVPKITMLSNPDYQDPAQQHWLIDNCPGGWTKCGTMGKGFQLNMESDKRGWLFDIMNQPWGGNYIKSRSEIWGDQLNAGWWTKNNYKGMFALMSYCIYWGMDWPNETTDIIQDPKYDSAFKFFNKYAGQKVPALAKNAACILKDVLDASDVARFPEAVYGTPDRNNKLRYTNIYNSFAAYGAKLEDPSVVNGSEFDCLTATGTNDVGWHLLPGNYERFLTQIDPNTTSAGYWNVDAAHVDAMFGRFARGFDLAKGKDALYFNVEDAFLRSTALNSKYPVTIEVTYYDSGTGSWQLYYDAQLAANKASVKVTCANTRTWKKTTTVLSDAYFGNRCTRNADFYIKNAGTGNVIFSMVELSRPEQSAIGFITSPVAGFDTVCLNSVNVAKTFVLNASGLNGTVVQVGPLNGFTFSTSDSGSYSSTLTYASYGTTINATVYVKINTGTEGNFSGNIPITGGGVTSANVNVNGVVLNTSPILNANVIPISCYNKKDAAIDLQPTGGIGPFTFKWTNNVQQFWESSSEDISGLQVANYTVAVNSFAGCATSKTFSITQPDLLVASVAADSAIKCKGGSTTVKVSATGGTLPYTGAGTFFVTSGFRSYTVTDARGCLDVQGYTVANGTLSTPSKPAGINGPASVKKNQVGVVFSVKTPNSSYLYIWTVPSGATITAGQNTSSITVTWGTFSGTVTVKSQTNCGTSATISKSVTATALLNMQMSNSSSIETAALNKQFIVMPNPVKDVASLQFYAEKAFAYNIEISNIHGKILQVQKGSATAGTNTQRINVQGLSQGQYFVTLINDRGEIQTIKLIKL